MSTLQLSLLIIGVVVVAGVYAYNLYQERQARRKMDQAFVQHDDVLLEPRTQAPAGDGQSLARRRDVEFSEVVETAPPVSPPAGSAPAAGAAMSRPPGEGPDPYIECVVVLNEVRIPADALQRLMALDFTKPVRWFGRVGNMWHALAPDRTYEEGAVCLLLADRAGPANADQIHQFFSLMREGAGILWALPALPDLPAEVARAAELDRQCADLDIQVGLNIVCKSGTAITGQRLRGAAENSGFHLNDHGEFQYARDGSGAAQFILTDLEPRPLRAADLEKLQTTGVTLLLDVPRVADPVAAFDQMCGVAKRLAPALEASLLDDNRQPLSDAGLDAIRAQIQQTAATLRGANIEAGGARALRLFS
jgi:FtsZ-interacting cell division protein ZipA